MTQSSTVRGWDGMLDLPHDIIVHHLLQPYLSVRDLGALRQASSLCRRLANAAVTSCVLDAGADNQNAQQQVPRSFVNLQCLKVSCTPASPGSHPPAADSCTRDLVVGSFPPTNTCSRITQQHCTPQHTPGSSNLMSLQQQLPALITQLPHLTHLIYEGPKDRRQQGLDMTATLQALLHTQLTPAALAQPSTPHTPSQSMVAGAPQAPHCLALVGQGSCMSDRQQAGPVTVTGPPPSPSHGSAQPTADAAAGVCLGAAGGGDGGGGGGGGAAPSSCTLSALELTSGSLPDRLMEVVGSHKHLVSLKLTSTTAIHMAPVARLEHLTAVTLTVTPPLLSAVVPLSRLPRLCQLCLSALSPARGWGVALARLASCPMRSLTLTFADIGDDDLQHMAAALPHLTHLNLNYSRHLTAASVPHLASLPNLCALHLEETGLTLSERELLMLGLGCQQLSTLEAPFDLRNTPAPDRLQQQSRELSNSPGSLVLLQASPPTPPARPYPPSGGHLASSMGRLLLGDDASPRTSLEVPVSTSPAGPSEGWWKVSRLGKWPPLSELILNGVSVMDFHKVLVGCPGLKVLVLDLCRGLNADNLLRALQLHCPALEELTIHQGSSISYPVLQDVCSHRVMQQLRVLVLSGLEVPHEALSSALFTLVSRSRSLQSLHLSRCRQLCDAALTAGLSKATRLTSLELSNCNGITASGVLALAGSLPGLRRLVVRGCPKVEPGTARLWEVQVSKAAAQTAAAASWASRQQVTVE